VNWFWQVDPVSKNWTIEYFNGEQWNYKETIRAPLETALKYIHCFPDPNRFRILDRYHKVCTGIKIKE